MLQRCLVVALVALIATGSVFARKLPEGAYIKTAKIEVLSGDLERYKTAQAMLDSLFINYGPHAEGMYWQCQIMVDILDKAPGLEAKRQYATTLVKLIDSLAWICGNEAIKPNYRKGCDKFLKGMDTTRESIWREFYNAGVAQVSEIQKVSEEMKGVTDSVALAFYQNRLPALSDSCTQNMTLAILVDPSDSRSYIGLGTIYESQGKFDSSNTWLKMGLERIKEKGPILSQVAYNYIQLNDYCGAIPYFKEMIALNPGDTSSVPTMLNLAICYNNCKQFDSALLVQRQILEISPTNTDALTGIGRYFNTQARLANDSVNALTDEAGKKKWSTARDNAFDSSKAYFKKVYDLKTDDQFAAEEYALVCALRSDYKSAAEAFKRASDLDPKIAENWTSLGDCYLNLKQFKDAIVAYEKVVELEPSNREIWERLRDLYQQEKLPVKQAEADKKLKEI